MQPAKYAVHMEKFEVDQSNRNIYPIINVISVISSLISSMGAYVCVKNVQGPSQERQHTLGV